GAIAGFLAALAAFWLIARMTGSNWYGMAGSLVVFAGGALAAGEGAMPEIFFDGFSYPYFPGFRRYIPAMAMAAVFGLFAFVWKVLEGAEPGAGGKSSPPPEGGVAAASADGVVLSAATERDIDESSRREPARPQRLGHPSFGRRG